MNPILPRTDFIPDAEAHVMPDGRLYIYGSMDYSGHKEYCGTTYKVFSTGDPKLEDWTDHGISFSNGADDNLTWKPGVTLCAPDAIGRDGKYYLYMCGAEAFEGVSVSDKPQGPFGRAKPILHADGDSIDPAVFIDDDGQAYYLWGQFNLRGAKLSDDMSELDEGSIITNLLTEQEHGFHEGSSMRKRNGLYYIVYTDISRGKATCMSYATSDKPLGPYKKGGVIIDNIYCDPDTWNNHGSIEEYKGQWYVFYHRSTQNCNACRRVCAEPIFFDENGHIAEVLMTSQGASSPISAFGDIDASVACRLKGNAYITVCEGHGEILTRCGGGNWTYDWAEYRYINFDEGVNKSNSAAADDSFTFSVCSRGSGRIHVMSEKDGRSFIYGICNIASEDFSVFEARIHKIEGVRPYGCCLKEKIFLLTPSVSNHKNKRLFMFNLKKTFQGYISLTIVLSSLFLSLSCANSADIKDDTGAAVSDIATETVITETADPDYISDLPAQADLEGFDFHILARVSNNDYSYTESWSSHDMDCEEQTGELIDDAVFGRNLLIEDTYNCSIHATYAANVGNELKKLISAGDNTYSISSPATGDAATLAAAGYLYNFYNVPNINLSKKYWDTGLVSGLTINGKLYFATGDIMIMDNDATWVLYFNKTMLADYNLVSPYEYVRNDTWTMDAFYSMTSDVSNDIDGDGKFTKTDRYGLVSHNGGFSNFQYFGNQPVISAVDGSYEITYNNESMYKLVELTNKIVNNKETTFNIADWYDGVVIFSESRGLFYLEVLDKFRHLRGSDIDFGVVPAPKLDENQEFYTTVIDGITSLVVIPSSNSSLDETGMILEAMAAGSVDTLTEAYYDKNLTGKFMRDDDSAEMLDIILAHRLYDVARFYNISSTTSLFGNLIIKNSNDFASGYTKLESAAVKSLGKLLDTLEMLP